MRLAQKPYQKLWKNVEKYIYIEILKNIAENDAYQPKYTPGNVL